MNAKQNNCKKREEVFCFLKLHILRLALTRERKTYSQSRVWVENFLNPNRRREEGIWNKRDVDGKFSIERCYENVVFAEEKITTGQES